MARIETRGASQPIFQAQCDAELIARGLLSGERKLIVVRSGRRLCPNRRGDEVMCLAGVMRWRTCRRLRPPMLVPGTMSPGCVLFEHSMTPMWRSRARHRR